MERSRAAERAALEREKHDRLLHRVSTDPAHRQRLKDRPKETLREAGIEVPDDVDVTVVEFDPKHRFLFLPPPQ
jgi:anion-transporting  ArsA/GET3 family ATPase